MNQLTQDGISALKSGDKERAQQLFIAALQEDGDDLQAWLWLSGAVENDSDRLECLEQVLRIDPSHALATKGVAQLKARGVKPPEAPAPQDETPQWAQEASGAFDSSYEADQPADDIFAEAADVPTLSSLNEGLDDRRERTQPHKVEPGGQGMDRSVEKIVLKTKPSLLPVAVIGGLIALLAVFLVVTLFPILVVNIPVDANLVFLSMLVVVALIIAAVSVRVLQQIFTAYILTSRRLIVEDSLVSRAQKSVPLTKIQGISYRQNLAGRIFGLGTVMLAANGENGPIQMHDLKEYVTLAEQIEAAVEALLRE